MIPVPSGVRVWLATGYTDMRRGFPGLSLMVQETLKRDPMSGHLFVFRGRSGGLIKVIWHDGQGACLFTKKLERGRFIWPSAADGTVASDVGRMNKTAGTAGANMIPSRHDRCGRSASRRPCQRACDDPRRACGPP